MVKASFVATAVMLGAVLPLQAQAQSATATSPSRSSSGDGGSAAPIGPSGGTSAGAPRVGGPNAPAIGGNTQTDQRIEKENDKKMSICKGC